MAFGFGVAEAAVGGALMADVPVVAYIGSGFDRVYPHALAPIIEAGGLLVSIVRPNEVIRRSNLPSLDNLMLTRSERVIYVEGSTRSRSHATAAQALDRGIPVEVVPGPLTSMLSAGPHSLVAEGATLVTTTPA